MVSLINALFYIINGVIGFVLFAMIASALISWLVVFGIIRPYHPTARSIMDILDRITYPFVAPFRNLIPNFGGLDLSFLVAILLLRALQIYLLPAAQIALLQLVG